MGQHIQHISHISESDIMWLAGLLEGEGCFDQTNTKVPRVRLRMTDADVVDRMAMIIGAHITRVKTVPPRGLGKLESYSLEIGGISAIELMKQLLPQMGGRRSNKIREILQNCHSRYD